MFLTEVLKNNCNIYCICLQERPDRYKHACLEFDKVGIREYVHFHRPTRHEKGGIYGNFESMLWCLNNSLQRDPMKLVVIFEDDVCFSVNNFKSFNFDSIFLKFIHEWDTIRLGYWKGVFIEHLNNTSFYRGNCRGAHAVIWSPIFAQKVLKHNITIEKRGVIDWYLSEISGRHYLIHKALCFQRPGMTTDVIWPFTNIQNNFQENPIQFQLKYQQRTHNAWNIIGRYIPNNTLCGLFQIGIILDWTELWNMIRTLKCFFIFKNKSLL
jgi:hypothetical protein